MKFFCLILLLVSSTTNAADFNIWTQEQKNWYIASNVMLALDWGTTRDISKNREYTEVNPFLGKNPSTSRVNNYFLGYFITNYLIASNLSSENRTTYLKMVTTLEFMAVGNNLALGLNIRF